LKSNICIFSYMYIIWVYRYNLKNMNNEIKKVKIQIWLTEENTFEELYKNWYSQNLHIDFIENKEEKKHNINSHSNWFNKKIKINHEKEKLEVINKWKLCMVDYGMNIWTEINWIRPSLVFKSSSSKYGEDIIVIPITSFKDWEIKSIDEFDIEILPDNDNNLTNKSLIKLRQLRCISKKRIRSRRWSDKLNIFWEIKDNSVREMINTNIKLMLWV